ncbi:MAG: hypothetical protein ACI4OA_03030 [Selenomonadaceae bacterium]
MVFSPEQTHFILLIVLVILGVTLVLDVVKLVLVRRLPPEQRKLQPLLIVMMIIKAVICAYLVWQMTKLS